MLIDSHCHLDDPLLSDRLPEVMAAAETCSVGGFIVPGVDPRGWERIMSLAREDKRIFAAPGIHPMKAALWCPAAAEKLRKLTSEIVAVGEIGLDYSEGMPPRELQQEVFRAQLKIAGAADLPVIIHCRRAFADTLRILADERIERTGGVMHAFSGSLELARDCVSLGLKIGMAGSVTWANAIKPLLLVKAIAVEHLLLETDSPDISPEPHRGMVNEPSFLLDTALKVAEIKGLSLDEIAAATAQTTRSLFRLA